MLDVPTLPPTLLRPVMDVPKLDDGCPEVDVGDAGYPNVAPPDDVCPEVDATLIMDVPTLVLDVGAIAK